VKFILFVEGNSEQLALPEFLNRKILDGSDLFSRLDPEIAGRKCPRLKEMLDEMLKLAKECEN